MINSPGFQSWTHMQNSSWLAEVKSTMQEDRWPTECIRCQTTETQNGHSIRLHSLSRHQILGAVRPDYIIIGGILDNVCNSACQSCNAQLSTKIGSLSGKDYMIVDNRHLWSGIPQDRVVEIDINGGEPTASPRYQQLIKQLPDSVKILRVNTNGSRVLPSVEKILERGIKLIITVSLDGTGRIHDYVRWPIEWKVFCNTINQYQTLAKEHRNLELQAWTTVHALNLLDMDNIKQFARDNGLKHDWAYLEQPQQLNVKYANRFTRPYHHVAPDIIAKDKDNEEEIDHFIYQQDNLRGINIKDYI